jgi:hypothetical protein
LLVGAAIAFGAGALARTPSKVPEFHHDVLPILKAHCASCHSGGDPAGKLALGSAAQILKGGKSGPAARVGHAADSLLIKRIKGIGGDRMPLGGPPLSADDLATITAWIDGGCKDSGDAAKHWAYVPPVKAKVPNLKSPWVRNPIDAFVLARLKAHKLHPSPEADKETLLRRVTLDLTGLPPTIAEIDAFLADRSPGAYEKVVDRLLASPHYGERMALPWLDAARYADSNGFQTDGDNHQYVWRDWVVRAFNADMPYDKFTVDQLAGDLLPNPTQDEIVATAFNRNHMLNGEGGAIPEEQRFIGLFDRVDTTSTTWLGITMACSRCHDHKYDPFTQRDYYSLLAYFNNLPETGIVSTGGQYQVAAPTIYAGDPKDVAAANQLEKDVAAADDAQRKAKPKTPEADAAKKKADELRKQLDAIRLKVPRVMVMSDTQPRVSHILARGNYTSPLAEVHGSTPLVFPALAGAPPNRLGFAEWVISPKDPLAARVEVNRIWQTFWSRGLVKTSENFGVQTDAPPEQDLLDWLAVDFRDHGWDIKRLVRQIVTSSTYRQSSRVTAAMVKLDPENSLLSRGARFRLPSMILRDLALASCGLLNPAVAGTPVYPYQPPGIWDSLDITDERSFAYPQSHGPDLYRRSIYTFWRRTISPGDMFDSATRQTCTVNDPITSTPMHALTTLNDVTWVEAARVLAQNVIHGRPTADERLTLAFRSICGRAPSKWELGVLRSSLWRSANEYSGNVQAASQLISEGESPHDAKIDVAWFAAYTTVCLSIYNLDEALTRE